MFVYSGAAFVAQVLKQPRDADYFNACAPWMLLHNTGRIDRFESQAQAREEASKAWPAVRFTRAAEVRA